MTKRDNNLLRLARRLADGQWHTSLDLVQHAGIRANGRLWDLRRRHRIDVEKRSTGEDQFEYRWRDDAETRHAVVTALEMGLAPPPEAPVEPKQMALI